MNKQGKNEKRHTKAEIVTWIQAATAGDSREIAWAFEDMDYEQLQCWLSELQLKRKLFEVDSETYYTTIEERK